MLHAIGGAPHTTPDTSFFGALARLKLPSYTWNVLMALRNIDASKRRYDAVTLKFLEYCTGLRFSQISRALTTLNGEGIITKERVGRTGFAIQLIYDPEQWAQTEPSTFSDTANQICSDRKSERDLTIYRVKENYRKDDTPLPPNDMEAQLPTTVAEAWDAWNPAPFSQDIVRELRALLDEHSEETVLQAIATARSRAQHYTSPISYIRSICRNTRALAVPQTLGFPLPAAIPRTVNLPDKTSMGTLEHAPGTDAAKRVVVAVIQGTRLPLLAESTDVSIAEAQALIAEVESAATNPHDPEETIALIELAASAIPRESFWAKKLNKVAQFRAHFTRFYILVRDRIELQQQLDAQKKARANDPDLLRRERVLALMRKSNNH